jgi:hypothetical protein
LPKRDAKAERLKALGVLNPHPERVRASWFSADQFFDARDLVQVKYEMLPSSRVKTARRITVEGAVTFDVARRCAEASMIRPCGSRFGSLHRCPCH